MKIGTPRTMRLVGIASPKILLLLALPLAGGNRLQAQSLYNEGTYRSLAGDNKAIRPGDVITVQVIENASATARADTTTQRNNNLGADVLLTPSGRQRGLTVGVGGNFDGGGTTERASRLLAMLTVTVREVLPNGDLKVSGEQILTVNNEKHKVTLEGRVRQQDVSSDNVVLSSRLADAQINYVGDGDLSDRQKRAFWRRVADWLGL